MPKVLVTGASGFVGRQTIVPLLKYGYEVHATCHSRPPEQFETDGLRYHEVDLLNEDQAARLVKLVKPDYLLHLAWHTTPGEYWHSDRNLDWVKASVSLLQTFASRGGKRVTIAGSCAEYDWQGGVCSETETALKPSTLYGNSKLTLGNLYQSFCLKHDISYSAGRIFYVFGPHEYPQRLVPSIICPLLQGQQATCLAGSQKRDFLYVEDVGHAFAQLLASDVTGAVNIGSGKAVSVREICLKIAEKLGAQELLQISTEPGTQQSAPLVVADVRRLTREVRFTPEIDLDNGIDRSIEFWKQNLRHASKQVVMPRQ